MEKERSGGHRSSRLAVRIIGTGCLVALLWGLHDFLPAAVQVNESSEALSREAAEAAAEKLGQVREGSLSSTSSRAVRLSEAEANSYFQYHMAYLFPAGLSNVRVKFEPNRPQGWAEVDFDRLKETLRRPPNPFVDYLLQGVHTLGVQGTFDSSNGMGEFRWETVTMDGVVLPRAMVDFLIESYLKARYPQAAIDQPFRLPYSLEKVVVEAGSCLMISKPASL